MRSGQTLSGQTSLQKGTGDPEWAGARADQKLMGKSRVCLDTRCMKRAGCRAETLGVGIGNNRAAAEGGGKQSGAAGTVPLAGCGGRLCGPGLRKLDWRVCK